MRNPEWLSLSDAEKGQLVSMWMLAADKKGKIPADPHVIATLCYLDDLPDLQRFQNLKFIEGWRHVDAKLTPRRRQHDATETETEADKSRVDTPPYPPRGDENGFQEFWQAYPRKVGKGAARRSWKRIRPDAELQQKILNSLAEHKYSHDWTREHGRFIPHPATFLNQERWEDELATLEPDPERTPERMEAIDRRLAYEAERGEELVRKHREREDNDDDETL